MRAGPVLLAFDTSAAHCAAAVLAGDAIRVERREPMARGQAERLMPLLEEVLAEAGLGWHDLDALAVGIGPGNFTGIRIAVSARWKRRPRAWPGPASASPTRAGV